MCAIFGFVATGDSGPRLKTLAAIAEANVNRGPHAFGFAWLDARGRMRCYKQTGRLVDHIGVLALARGARMLIGHLRWATHGDYSNNLNNHPHPADSGWIVHNGIVMNYASLVRGKRLWPVSECDSEVLGLLIEQSAGTLARRCARAVRLTTGPLAMLGLWSRPAGLLAVRRGNPLHAGAAGEGMYLGTLIDALPGRAKSLPDNRVIQFRSEAGRIVNKSIELPARFADHRKTEPSLYCGG